MELHSMFPDIILWNIESTYTEAEAPCSLRRQKIAESIRAYKLQTGLYHFTQGFLKQLACVALLRQPV